MGLIEEAFPDKDPKILQKLWEDDRSRSLLLEKIGRALYNNSERFFVQDPTNQLIALLSQAQFRYQPEECVQVAGLIAHTMPVNQEYPGILPHFNSYLGELESLKGKRSGNKRQMVRIRQTFGASCLVSLALFHKALKARESAGYPSPEWYRMQGKHALYHAEMEEVTNNFERWEAYLNERFN